MKKFILSLLLIFAVVLGLTSCNYVGDIFKRKTSSKNNPTPTTTTTIDTPTTTSTTEQVETKYKIIFHENGHGTSPDEITDVDEIPSSLPIILVASNSPSLFAFSNASANLRP